MPHSTLACCLRRERLTIVVPLPRCECVVGERAWQAYGNSRRLAKDRATNLRENPRVSCPRLVPIVAHMAILHQRTEPDA
jgi:hypothetical protein